MVAALAQYSDGLFVRFASEAAMVAQRGERPPAGFSRVWRRVEAGGGPCS